MFFISLKIFHMGIFLKVNKYAIIYVYLCILVKGFGLSKNLPLSNASWQYVLATIVFYWIKGVLWRPYISSTCLDKARINYIIMAESKRFSNVLVNNLTTTISSSYCAIFNGYWILAEYVPQVLVKPGTVTHKGWIQFPYLLIAWQHHVIIVVHLILLDAVAHIGMRYFIVFHILRISRMIAE